MTADLVAPVLQFLGRVSHEVYMKGWLAGPEGSAFWPVLLRLLCTTPTQTAPTQGAAGSARHKVRAYTTLWIINLVK